MIGPHDSCGGHGAVVARMLCTTDSLNRGFSLHKVRGSKPRVSKKNPHFFADSPETTETGLAFYVPIRLFSAYYFFLADSDVDDGDTIRKRTSLFFHSTHPQIKWENIFILNTRMDSYIAPRVGAPDY